MKAPPTDEALVALWNEAERAFAAASRNVQSGKRFCVASVGTPRRLGAPCWSAMVGGEQVSNAPFGDVGMALTRLAQALRLIRRPRDGVVEYARAECLQGDFVVSIESLPDESAWVRVLGRATDVIDFVASRRRRGRPRSAWDTACRRRLVRSDPQGHVCVIEPGVVWFVEWLESVGARTIYSCEGHPDGFHVAFRGPHALAHALAGIPNAVVEIFRSGAFPQTDQWCLRLRQHSRDRKERDKFLSGLAEAFSAISCDPTPD